MILKYVFTFCMMLVLAMGAAYAQSTIKKDGTPELDSEGVPYSSKYYPVKPKNNIISLVRKPELTEDQFVLRITDAQPRNGCVDISNYSYEAVYKDVYLDITIQDKIYDLRNQPQYAHFQCDQTYQIPTADIIINRSDLMTNQTQQIRMHNGTDSNYYNITLTDDRVMILPDESNVSSIKRFTAGEIPGRKTALSYWFYPLGTVLLWAPALENTPATAEKVRNFARTRGLTPLETVFPNFQSPLNDTKYHYFVDTEGRFTKDTELGNGMPIGNIAVEKTVYGLEKDEIELHDVAVYAKTPGLND